MRGSEAVKRRREHEARALGATDVRTCIISCTGNADSDKRRILQSGADAVWNKPMPSFTDGSMQSHIAKLMPHAAKRRTAAV